MHTASEQYSYIKPDQLRVGLYVHLDLSWVKHPFSFPSFKIENHQQIITIQQLGLERIRCTSDKSEGDPLAVVACSKSAIEVGSQTPLSHKVKQKIVQKVAKDVGCICVEKSQIIERIDKLNKKILTGEGEFLVAVQTLKRMWQNMGENPSIVARQANELIESVVDSVMMESEIAIHLILRNETASESGSNIYNHAMKVAILAMMMAKEMGCTIEQIKWVGIGALFHDAGYTDLPSRIQEKMAPLTPVEEDVMQQHCKHAVDICNKLQLPYESIVIVWQHHERADGSGYPEKLNGNKISPLANIVAVADAFEELCNPANLKQSYTPHEALSLMYAQRRPQFDGKTLTALIHCSGVYPPGTIVLLTNSMIGKVVALNHKHPLKPTVHVYDPATTENDLILIDLEHETGVNILRTMQPQQLSSEIRRFFFRH